MKKCNLSQYIGLFILILCLFYFIFNYKNNILIEGNTNKNQGQEQEQEQEQEQVQEQEQDKDNSKTAKSSKLTLRGIKKEIKKKEKMIDDMKESLNLEENKDALAKLADLNKQLIELMTIAANAGEGSVVGLGVAGHIHKNSLPAIKRYIDSIYNNADIDDEYNDSLSKTSNKYF